MPMPLRIDAIVELLQDYALGTIDLPEQRVMAALKVLDWAIDDASTPEAPEPARAATFTAG
jgi:hypothetical protein